MIFFNFKVLKISSLQVDQSLNLMTANWFVHSCQFAVMSVAALWVFLLLVGLLSLVPLFFSLHPFVF